MPLFTGETVEEAISNGLVWLGLSRSEAKITIISKEKKGFFGFGKQEAQVKITPLEEGETEERQTPRRSQRVTEPSPVEEDFSDSLEESSAAFDGEEEASFLTEVSHQENAPEPVSETEEVVPPLPKPQVVATFVPVTSSSATPSTDDDQDSQVAIEQDSPETSTEDVKEAEAIADQASDEGAGEQTLVESLPNPVDMTEISQNLLHYVMSIIFEMDIDASVSVSSQRRQLIFQVDTSEPGRIIGYHGKVLKALQLLAQNYVYNRYNTQLYVTINVNDYIENRIQVLEKMARKAARRVQEGQSSYRLEPMNNTERKIIHKAISKISGVESYSEGDEPHRYVVVVSRD